jgi:hypothetical protein
MKLEYILTFIEYLYFPKSTLFRRLIVLKYIITVLLHVANMGLIEKFAVIFKQDIEYPIVIDTTILQK